MNIPKWLIVLWAVEIVLSEIVMVPFFPLEVVFWSVTITTAVWIFREKPKSRFYIVLWAVTLPLVSFSNHLRPAHGAMSTLDLYKGALALAIAAAISLVVWTARKFHKPTTRSV